VQYTVRGIPVDLDVALRARARAAGKSLNEAAIEALAEGTDMIGAPRKRRNLGDISGTWKADKAFEAAIAAQDRVDEDLPARHLAQDDGAVVTPTAYVKFRPLA
jgi:hypothetical protein